MYTPHSYSQDKFVFGDTAKKSAFSDAAASHDAQKTCAPRPSHSHKFVLSDTAKSRRSVTSQRLVTLKKHVDPGIHTANDKSMSSGAAKNQHLVTLQL